MNAKICKEEKMDIISAFFKKQGKKCGKGLTVKVMDEVILKYNIDLVKEMEDIKLEKALIEQKKEEKYRMIKEEYRKKDEAKEKDRQYFKNLPAFVRELCEKKYEEIEGIRELKNKNYEKTVGENLVADSLRRGNSPHSTFMNEDGTATIGGIIVHSCFNDLEDHIPIYEKQYIKDLINGLNIYTGKKVMIRVKKIRA